jgi:hypothetical protein
MSDNRYAAPASMVADPEEPAIVGRPRNVVIGVYLLWIELALGIPGMFSQILSPSSEIPDGQIRSVYFVVMTLIMVGSVALYSWLNWKCWKGRHWARVVHLVFLGFGLVVIFWALPATLAASTLLGVVYIVQTILNIAGVALLFSRPANAWYQGLRATRP